MALLRFALKIAQPVSLLAFCAALAFLYFRTRTSKSLNALANLPEDDRKEAFAVLTSGIIPALGRRATPAELSAFTAQFTARQQTLRTIFALTTALFAIVLVVQILVDDYTVPRKPPKPRIVALSCSERVAGEHAPFVRVSLTSLADLPTSYSTVVRARSGWLPFARTLGELTLTHIDDAEFFFESPRRKLYVRIELEDLRGKLLRRSLPATRLATQIPSPC